MITLKQSLAAQEAAEATLAASSRSAPSHSLRPVADKLQIEGSGTRFWVLPWSQFVGLDYEEKAGGEELVLRFTGYEVVVRGWRLARLRPEVVAGRLELLRTQPHAEMAALKGSDPVVSRIRVFVLGRQVRTESEAETS